MKLLSVKPSTNPDKKYMATFQLPNGREKTTHFGASGYQDFRQNRSEERKMNYLKRHERRETWSDPTTAGALARWLLWNKPTLAESIKDFKQRFNL
jgi:hypothetical protein